jgi:hypothetical protein
MARVEVTAVDLGLRRRATGAPKYAPKEFPIRGCPTDVDVAHTWQPAAVRAIKLLFERDRFKPKLFRLQQIAKDAYTNTISRNFRSASVTLSEHEVCVAGNLRWCVVGSHEDM